MSPLCCETCLRQWLGFGKLRFFLAARSDILVQVGGVVVRSPFIAIAAYEREHGIPDNYLNCSMYVFSVGYV